VNTFDPVAFDPAALVRTLLDGADSFAGCRIERLQPLESTVDTTLVRPISVDQTNESVVVGESVVVKTYKTVVRRGALLLVRHLTSAGFDGVPDCYAAAVRDGVLAALVTGYLPGARDGWEWCVAHFDEDFGADLGRLAAGLHLALATMPVDPPVVARDSDVAEWGRAAHAALDEALALTGGADGEWLATRAERIGADLEMPDATGTPVQHIHGDLHVGQVLRFDGGYRVIDFDGNPTITRHTEPQPVARDLAQLLTSLDHVAMIVAKTHPREAAVARGTALRAATFGAYREALARGGGDGLLDERLLRPFEVEQECREIVYAQRFLPRWRYAPMGVLKRWYA
jgi:maltokinase